MIHEKFIPGKFLLDLKNDRSELLQAAAMAHHHQPHSIHHLQPPSPPMPALDIYSAYAYQQQLQHQLLNSVGSNHLLSTTTTTTSSNRSPQPTEVLDLSRRNSLDLPNKTCSPYNTGSSFSSESPSVSPNNLITTPQQSAPALLPSNLLYATHVQPANSLNIPANLAALCPGFYYPNSTVKSEPMSTTPPPANQQPTPANVTANSTPAVSNNNLLQTFASAAAVAAVSSFKPHTPEPQSPKQPSHSLVTATTPTSSTNSLSAFDPKNTRPFKAFPRDPLVIAANFAATDVLLDNPRVERYTEYRKRVLEQIRSSNGGSHTVTNPKMRRTNSCSGKIQDNSYSNTSENDERQHEESSDCESNSGHENQTTTTSTNDTKSDVTTANNTSNSSNGGLVKDAAYYERRRKNNAAAKKSRDRRRIKEDEIAIRAAYLERQNIELLCQIDALKAQLAALSARK
ncbi:hypothetical protein DOY81_003633 [Sarcophaga bullata]|nr:hypothetical protein DOY81_003633 [Sarcophaga bullata]